MAEAKKVLPLNSPIKQHVDAVLRTESGRAFWAHLFHECGYNVSSLTRKADGDVASLPTECKEAQRLVYINLRKLASRELLAKAEELAETPVVAPKPQEEERKK